MIWKVSRQYLMLLNRRSPIYLFLYLPLYLSIYLYVYLSIYLSSDLESKPTVPDAPKEELIPSVEQPEKQSESKQKKVKKVPTTYLIFWD